MIRLTITTRFPWPKLSKGDFACKKCGFVFPKKGANISGWNDAQNGLHVHCPECGAIVQQYLKLV